MGTQIWLSYQRPFLNKRPTPFWTLEGRTEQEPTETNFTTCVSSDLQLFLMSRNILN